MEHSPLHDICGLVLDAMEKRDNESLAKLANALSPILSKHQLGLSTCLRLHMALSHYFNSLYGIEPCLAEIALYAAYMDSGVARVCYILED
jgi:hypothetical protein